MSQQSQKPTSLSLSLSLEMVFFICITTLMMRMYVYLDSHITLSIRNRQEDQLIFVSAYSVALRCVVRILFFAYIESPKIKQNCLIQGI